MTAMPGLQWAPGSRGAQQQLQTFLKDSLPGFSFNRAKTDRDSTSRLSPHLHIGELSCRALFHTVLPLCKRAVLPHLAAELLGLVIHGDMVQHAAASLSLSFSLSLSLSRLQSNLSAAAGQEL